MIKDEVERLVREQKISADQLVREEWEMKVLQLFFDMAIGRKTIFKGGTALRLGYGSPRFSEDLDFSVVQGLEITGVEIQEFINRVKNTYAETRVSDQQIKFNTVLIEFKITDPILTRNFALKIEISTRGTNIQSSTSLLSSPTTNIQVLANMETLDGLYGDKLDALKDRGKPRDLFDIWYICQKLRQPLPKDLSKIAKREIRQELNKFLPMNFAPVVMELEDRYGL